MKTKIFFILMLCMFVITANNCKEITADYNQLVLEFIGANPAAINAGDETVLTVQPSIQVINPNGADQGADEAVKAIEYKWELVKGPDEGDEGTFNPVEANAQTVIWTSPTNPTKKLFVFKVTCKYGEVEVVGYATVDVNNGYETNVPIVANADNVAKTNNGARYLGNGIIRLAWHPILIADGYNTQLEEYYIYRSLSASGPWKFVGERNQSTGSIYEVYSGTELFFFNDDEKKTDNDLEPNTEYYYRIIPVINEAEKTDQAAAAGPVTFAPFYVDDTETPVAKFNNSYIGTWNRDYVPSSSGVYNTSNLGKCFIPEEGDYLYFYSMVTYDCQIVYASAGTNTANEYLQTTFTTNFFRMDLGTGKVYAIPVMGIGVGDFNPVIDNSYREDEFSDYPPTSTTIVDFDFVDGESNKIVAVTSDGYLMVFTIRDNLSKDAWNGPYSAPATESGLCADYIQNVSTLIQYGDIENPPNSFGGRYAGLPFTPTTIAVDGTTLYMLESGGDFARQRNYYDENNFVGSSDFYYESNFIEKDEFTNYDIYQNSFVQLAVVNGNILLIGVDDSNNSFHNAGILALSTIKEVAGLSDVRVNKGIYVNWMSYGGGIGMDYRSSSTGLIMGESRSNEQRIYAVTLGELQ
jgi:hypothetical protein